MKRVTEDQQNKVPESRFAASALIPLHPQEKAQPMTSRAVAEAGAGAGAVTAKAWVCRRSVRQLLLLPSRAEMLKAGGGILQHWMVREQMQRFRQIHEIIYPRLD